MCIDVGLEEEDGSLGSLSLQLWRSRSVVISSVNFDGFPGHLFPVNLLVIIMR